MAFSLMGEWDRYNDTYGVALIGYGGFGSIAGDPNKKGGGSPGSGGTKKPEPSAPVPPTPKQFNPSDYDYMRHSDNHKYSAPDSWIYYNGTYTNDSGYKVECDGWIIYQTGWEHPLQPCPKKIPVSYLDWHFMP